MKCNDNGTIREMYVKAVNTNIKNEASTSTEDTYSCNYINKLHTYSEEEQVIGTWVDGKPIYRKVISNTNITTGGETSIPANIPNLREFTKFECIMYRSNGTIFPVPRTHTTDMNYQVGIYYSTLQNNTIKIETGSNITDIAKVYIILEYTKTTN